MSKSHITLVAASEFKATVFVNGEEYGHALDADMGRWVISVPFVEGSDPMDEANDGPFDGCYPARDLAGLAYALTQCHNNVTAEVKN